MSVIFGSGGALSFMENRERRIDMSYGGSDVTLKK
jgi:hypothetical protein